MSGMAQGCYRLLVGVLAVSAGAAGGIALGKGMKATEFVGWDETQSRIVRVEARASSVPAAVRDLFRVIEADAAAAVNAAPTGSDPSFADPALELEAVHEIESINAGDFAPWLLER